MIGSRWFPLALAISQTVLFAAVIAGEYRRVAQSVRSAQGDWVGLFRRDLASGVDLSCGHYAQSRQSAILRWNTGPMLVALAGYSLAQQRVYCVEEWMMSATGTLCTACCAPPVWYLAARWLQRVTRRQGRPPFGQRWARGAIGVPMIFFALLAVVAVPITLLGVLLNAHLAVTGLGTLFWCGMASLWCAERAGRWSPLR